MKMTVKIGRPDWDPNPHKTQTDNWSWRQCVMVQFENQRFKWIPTYGQLAEIMNALVQAEKLNKELARTNYSR